MKAIVRIVLYCIVLYCIVVQLAYIIKYVINYTYVLDGFYLLYAEAYMYVQYTIAVLYNPSDYHTVQHIISVL